MGIIDFIFKQSFKVNILHTLPGRLRIHIPLLKKVQGELMPTVETLEELMFTVPGILSIEPNYISGNILIMYSADLINTSSIINCLNVIWKTLATNRFYLMDVDNEKLEQITEKLINYLKDEHVNLTNIIGEVRIPDEIWT